MESISTIYRFHLDHISISSGFNIDFHINLIFFLFRLHLHFFSIISRLLILFLGYVRVFSSGIIFLRPNAVIRLKLETFSK